MRDLELLLALGGDELVRAETHRLLLLTLGTGQHHDAAAHLGCELDGQMPQTANAHDADRLRGLQTIIVERCEDSGTGALQRCGVLVGDVVGDLEQGELAPDGVRAEAPLVQVGVAEHLALRAVDVVAREALLAVPAEAVVVAPAHSVAYLHHFAVGSGLLDDANALMAEDHVCFSLRDPVSDIGPRAMPGSGQDRFTYIMQICAANARSCYPDEYLVAG